MIYQNWKKSTFFVIPLMAVLGVGAIVAACTTEQAVTVGRVIAASTMTTNSAYITKGIVEWKKEYCKLSDLQREEMRRTVAESLKDNGILLAVSCQENFQETEKSVDKTQQETVE